MSWSPKSWTVGEPLTAAKMNTELRDNLNALKLPATVSYDGEEANNYSTTSTSFVLVDTDFELEITTLGGDVLCGFHGVAFGAQIKFFNVDIDGDLLLPYDGIVRTESSDGISFVRLITGLAADTYTFSLMWKVNLGTGTLFGNTGTASRSFSPQFWVREVS